MTTYAEGLELYSKEAEDDLISACLQDPRLLDELEIKAEHIYQTRVRVLLHTMTAMREDNQPIDLSTVADRLSREGKLESVGKVSGLTELMYFNPTTSIENLKFKEKLVREKFQYRQLIQAADQLRRVALEQRDLSEVQEITSRLTDIESNKDNKRESIKDVLLKVFDNIESRSNRLEEVTGIRTGFTDVDRILNGLHNSELTIIAARPSMGKTAFALNMGLGITNCNQAIPVVYSLETKNESLVERQITSTGRIDAQRLRAGHINDDEWKRLSHAMGELASKDMYYHDLSHCTPSYIRSDVKALKREHSGRDIVVIIDHLQLMKSDKKEPNRNAEVGTITRDLKMIAKELDIPIVLLSQLSRAVESRQDKRPMMSDLRDSGETEQNADNVAFLYRDDYYNADSESQGVVELIIGKQRNGPVGTVCLAFRKEINKFQTLERRLEHAN
ncbi:replicative DNA helicase [Jeotgalibacillus aurantiacus]|uniref:replicative DNA helicase n=1 Tax=Jeotgalibacillus aurantiacus TaxID=2763266 RepID=UPI001D0B14C8|nr:replicative DNA helicase [Jeotgalibacillus aurantiacus]